MIYPSRDPMLCNNPSKLDREMSAEYVRLVIYVVENLVSEESFITKTLWRVVKLANIIRTCRNLTDVPREILLLSLSKLRHTGYSGSFVSSDGVVTNIRTLGHNNQGS